MQRNVKILGPHLVWVGRIYYYVYTIFGYLRRRLQKQYIVRYIERPNDESENENGDWKINEW